MSVHKQDVNNFVESKLHQNCMLGLGWQQDMKHVEHIGHFEYVKSQERIDILLVDIQHDKIYHYCLHKMVHNLVHIAKKLHLEFGIMLVYYNLVKFDDTLVYQL
jgi:hypothetical protein